MTKQSSTKFYYSQEHRNIIRVCKVGIKALLNKKPLKDADRVFELLMDSFQNNINIMTDGYVARHKHDNNTYFHDIRIIDAGYISRLPISDDLINFYIPWHLMDGSSFQILFGKICSEPKKFKDKINPKDSTGYTILCQMELHHVYTNNKPNIPIRIIKQLSNDDLSAFMKEVQS